MSTQLIHGELSYQILGCAFGVYKELGPFYRESVYQRAMEIALQQAGLAFQRQQPVPVYFRGLTVGRGFVDLLVENRVILELKAVEAIHPTFVSQMIQYLAATGLDLGFVLNFGNLDRLGYKRVVLSQGKLS